MAYTSCLIQLVLFVAGRQSSSVLGVIVRSWLFKKPLKYMAILIGCYWLVNDVMRTASGNIISSPKEQFSLFLQCERPTGNLEKIPLYMYTCECHVTAPLLQRYRK